ncbi:cilia- and flagella- associated protein 210-like [Tubulanus polymorphus]|uniref:cilia- and flagella- associated protein 210-like n=1 Tax=Tubulanus polymorphus TaxID=672921 RepID=UPI003DA5CE6D
MASATVMHGRRKGQSKSAGLIDVNSLPPGVGSGNNMTIDELRSMTILSKSDWERIQYSLNRRQIEEEKIRKEREEREALRDRSKEIVKNWTNTIAGQRQKKLEARRIREEKEEEERKQVDIEEAKYQAEKRKEAIEKAKTQQYYQTDRVKQFHGALLLTEVLKEREAQLELKSLMSKADEGRDREWLEQTQREMEHGIREDQQAALQRLVKRKDCADFQKAQIKKHLHEADEVKEDGRHEGEELKRLAIQYALEKQRLEQIRHAEQKSTMNDNLRQINDVKRMKEVQRQQEEEEDEECRIFGAAKRKMMKLRAEKEKNLYNEKQTRLSKIRDKLAAQMKQKHDDEDERIRQAVEEGEAKRAAEDALKDAKTKVILEEMSKHRVEQMKDLEEQEALERRKELEMLLLRKEADRVFQQNEEEKRRRQFDERKKLSNFHLKQKDEHIDNATAAKQAELNQAKANVDLLQIEEEQFQEYANKVIDHCRKGGRNLYPLKKAAKAGCGGGLGPQFPGKGGIRPSYMVADLSGVQLPNYQRDSTNETKETIYGDNQTNKRLGFVWKKDKEAKQQKESC